jgi:ankyrin repeat protein
MFTLEFESTRPDLKPDLARILLILSHLGDLNITSLLIDNSADISATEEDRWIPLHLALWIGHDGMVQPLIDKHGGVFATDKYGQTLWDMALLWGGERAAWLLIERYTEVSATDK